MVKRDIRGRRIARPRRRDIKEQQMPRIEAGIDGPKIHQGASEESRADDEQERYRDLKYHQGLADEAAMAVGCGARSLFHSGVYVSSRGLPSRRKAEQQPTHYRNADAEGKHLPAEVRRKPSGLPRCREQARERVPAKITEKQPRNTAHSREQQALRHYLTHDPHAPRAERKAYAHFALARRSTREEQVGEIRAGKQQNKSGQAHPDELGRICSAACLRESRQLAPRACFGAPARNERTPCARRGAHADRASGNDGEPAARGNGRYCGAVSRLSWQEYAPAPALDILAARSVFAALRLADVFLLRRRFDNEWAAVRPCACLASHAN